LIAPGYRLIVKIGHFEINPGSIDAAIPPALTKINICSKHWLELCTHFEHRFKGLFGSKHSLDNMIAAFGLTRKANRSTVKAQKNRGQQLPKQ